jgi:hypothetical protein
MLSSVTSVLPATNFSAGRAVDDAADAPSATIATSQSCHRKSRDLNT